MLLEIILGCAVLDLFSGSVDKQTKINNLQDENKKLKKELEQLKNSKRL